MRASVQMTDRDGRLGGHRRHRRRMVMTGGVMVDGVVHQRRGPDDTITHVHSTIARTPATSGSAVALTGRISRRDTVEAVCGNMMMNEEHVSSFAFCVQSIDDLTLQ